MKQLIYSFLAVLVFLALSAFAEDEKSNDSSDISISESAGIISVIANMNTSEDGSALNITEWTYIWQDENGNCTSHAKPVLEGNIIEEVVDCPKGLTRIDEGDINFTKAVEAIQKSLSNKTTYERIFLVKPFNSTEPIWSFKIQEGQTILVGAISGDILKGSQEIGVGQKAKTRLLGASRGGISDTISDVIDTVSDAEYYICVDSCIAGCHSLPSDVYSPGYTLDNCISECPDDCKKN